jgi:hypothetical protein
MKIFLKPPTDSRNEKRKCQNFMAKPFFNEINDFFAGFQISAGVDLNPHAIQFNCVQVFCGLLRARL